MNKLVLMTKKYNLRGKKNGVVRNAMQRQFMISKWLVHCVPHDRIVIELKARLFLHLLVGVIVERRNVHQFMLLTLIPEQ